MSYHDRTMLYISTCLTYPDAPISLLPLAKQLNQLGIDIVFTPWQQSPHNGKILPLAAWDYAKFYPEFLQWIEQHATQFINPAPLMRWNSHKSYLCDLQDWGVSVIPTQRYSSETLWQADLSVLGKEVVLKPAVGQSGHAVTKIKVGEPLPDLTVYGDDIIVQPFIAEVASNGETSLIFFKGEFSHAIRRQPAPNEWRANSQYKVEISVREVEDKIIQYAQSILHKLPQMPVYARVDGTIIGDTFLLNELELIEPALYLDKVDGAAERFAKIIKQQL
ncbi:ATP-grasp domain-containing protein [Pelistega ratti]|nr:hypothetical protein [Pelistega ratti]